LTTFNDPEDTVPKRLHLDLTIQLQTNQRQSPWQQTPAGIQETNQEANQQKSHPYGWLSRLQLLR
jgi:hypothetical protein